jgi:hypothetical protein
VPERLGIGVFVHPKKVGGVVRHPLLVLLTSVTGMLLDVCLNGFAKLIMRRQIFQYEPAGSLKMLAVEVSSPVNAPAHWLRRLSCFGKPAPGSKALAQLSHQFSSFDINCFYNVAAP